MRGSNEWVNALESAFNKIDFIDSKSSNSTDINVSKNILAYRMGDILLWNENTLSLYCINVKISAENPTGNYYQELLWNIRPTFEVTKMILSPTESQLALYGTDGVQIVTMPTVRGLHGLFQDGADYVTCCSQTVDEKHFFMSGKTILCCKWHPGFSSPNVLAILTSENMFRIYRADNSYEPFQIIDLNIPLVSSKNVLGESFVSFDFSEESFVTTGNDEKVDQSGLYWNAYLLVGNGQVCSCAMFYNAKSAFKYVIQGPLSMYPPAEDNYGCDACSILYINSNPPTIVVATSEGKLHHCILLSSEDDALHPIDAKNKDILHVKEKSLYVYETVQLELSLKTASLESSAVEDIDPFSCSLQLYKDPVMKQRYHCCHISGLHSVQISWLSKLQEFFQGESVNIHHLDEGEHCIVEHLLCTKPLSSGSIIPIIGFTQVVDVILGSKVICLTEDLQISIFPLLQSCKTSKHALFFETPSEFKPVKLGGNFSDRITKILQKKSMNPLIKGNQMTSNQDSFKLLCRTTQVFREEYIQKYEQVQVELEKNTIRLNKMKSRQESDVMHLQKDCMDVTQRQKNLKDKFDKILNNQERLNNRLKNISHKVEIAIPMLSMSEEKMKKSLNIFQETVAGYEKSIRQISKKSENYLKERKKSNLSSTSSCSIITDEKAISIRTLLKKEGDEISQLKNDLKSLQNIF